MGQVVNLPILDLRVEVNNTLTSLHNVLICPIFKGHGGKLPAELNNPLIPVLLAQAILKENFYICNKVHERDYIGKSSVCQKFRARGGPPTG